MLGFKREGSSLVGYEKSFSYNLLKYSLRITLLLVLLFLTLIENYKRSY